MYESKVNRGLYQKVLSNQLIALILSKKKTLNILQSFDRTKKLTQRPNNTDKLDQENEKVAIKVTELLFLFFSKSEFCVSRFANRPDPFLHENPNLSSFASVKFCQRGVYLTFHIALRMLPKVLAKFLFSL